MKVREQNESLSLSQNIIIAMRTYDRASLSAIRTYECTASGDDITASATNNRI